MRESYFRKGQSFCMEMFNEWRFTYEWNFTVMETQRHDIT
jgi:hypothetical protein